MAVFYCYARPSHAYVNLSPGLDFETKIFYKKDAALLLEKEINKPNYVCKPIVIGSNTDPYQPAESQLKVTRSLLEIANKYQHPIAIINPGYRPTLAFWISVSLKNLCV